MMNDDEKKNKVDENNKQVDEQAQTSNAAASEESAAKSIDEIVTAAVSRAIEQYTSKQGALEDKIDSLGAKLDDKLAMLIEAGAVIRDEQVDTSQVTTQAKTPEDMGIEIKPLEDFDFSYYNQK